MINYLGTDGITRHCLEALALIIQSHDRPGAAILINGPEDSYGCRSHAFIIQHDGDLVIIRSGFASGYPGEGPKGLSKALAMLEYHDYEIRQAEITEQVLKKIEKSSLTEKDVTNIINSSKYSGIRVFDLVFDSDYEEVRNATIWEEFPINLPLPLIDPRILDLAINFWSDPDSALHKGYRRLEDIVRSKTNLNAYGSKLMSMAFLSDSSQLTWKGSSGNVKGIAGLFTSVYQAFRNPRAHSIVERKSQQELASEFMLLNSLFIQESLSVRRENIHGSTSGVEKN